MLTSDERDCGERGDENFHDLERTTVPPTRSGS
jgi:hypothetical protein